MSKRKFEEYRYYVETNRSSLSRRQLARRIEVRVPGSSAEVDPRQISTITVTSPRPVGKRICRVIEPTLSSPTGGIRMVAAHTGQHLALDKGGNMAGEIVITPPPKEVP